MPELEKPPLEVYLLGTVDFDEMQLLQRLLVFEHGERPGATLALCEHPPTVSVGRSGSRAYVVPDDDELKAMGIAVRRVDRRGGCVLHLPGQLVGYLVAPVGRKAEAARGHVRRIERVLLGVLDEFGLAGERRDVPGLFLGRGRVATIGVAVARGIAYHGFTLNVGPFLQPFDVLVEPGPGGSILRQTSMESRRQRPTPTSQAREAIVRLTKAAFELDRIHLYTRHPRLTRKVSTHAYAPSPG